MSFENTPSIQTTQVQNAPEPIANMPKVDVAQFKTLDDLINGILDELGNKGSALVIAAGAKTMDVAAAGVDRISQAASVPFDPDFSLKGTPAVGASAEGPAQGRGRQVGDETPQVSSARTEERGVRNEQRVITEIAHVDNSMSAQLETPNVPNVKGPSQEIGRFA